MPVYSYTLFDHFENCPRQAHERFWLGRKFPMGPEAQKAIDTHKALELRFVRKQPLQAGYGVYEPLVQALEGRGDEMGEWALAVDAQLRPCDFFAPEAWLRAKLDVLVMREYVALVADWKTGKPYEKDLQHLVCAALVLQSYPEIDTVVGFNIWLREQRMGQRYQFHRADLPSYWARILKIVREIESTEASGKWGERASPLCAYCGVTECPNNRSAR